MPSDSEPGADPPRRLVEFETSANPSRRLAELRAAALQRLRPRAGEAPPPDLTSSETVSTAATAATERENPPAAPTAAAEPRPLLPRPLVSVIYLTYNQEKYAAEAVRSILGQTYPNLEIIILDDASNDRTAALIAAELASSERQPQPRLIRNPQNLGESENTRKGLALAGGEFIVLFNGDDVMLPTMVDEMVGVWQRDGVSLVTVNGRIIDEEGKEQRYWRDPAAPFDDTFETLVRDGGNAVCFGAGIGFERQLYREFGWPPAYLTAEDIMVPFYAYLRKGARFIPQPLIKYRVRGGNSSMSLQREAAESSTHRLFTEAEDYSIHLARAVLMTAELDRLAVERPDEYGGGRFAALRPLLTTQIVEMAKKLVTARVELHKEGIALGKLPKQLADIDILKATVSPPLPDAIAKTGNDLSADSDRRLQKALAERAQADALLAKAQMEAALQASAAEKAKAEAATLRAELAERDAFIAKISGAKHFGEPVSAEHRVEADAAEAPPA